MKYDKVLEVRAFHLSVRWGGNRFVRALICTNTAPGIFDYLYLGGIMLTPFICWSEKAICQSGE